MIFRNKKEDNGWILVEYSATWRYGYDFMLDAAQIIIDTDMGAQLQRVAVSQLGGSGSRECLENVKAADYKLRDCVSTAEECSMLIISGISKIMECPVQFMFFNQTNLVRLFCPNKAYFEEHGDHVFDNYMNSVEIEAHVKAAKRSTPATTQVPVEKSGKEPTVITNSFQDKVVVITGGAQGIGKCIAEEFAKQGALVSVIDKQPGTHYVGDISDKAVLEAYGKYVIDTYGHVDYLINNAAPLFKGIDACTYEEFEYAQRVGVTAPFYLTQLFAPHFAPGASIINISSSRDRMSQPQTESYSATKGGISALTHALAVSLAGKVRVNSISPGWIDTDYKEYIGPDAQQQPVGRVGNPMDIANMVLYLCSDKAGFITGENICIDGGMTRHMIYHGEHGWNLGANVPKK